MPSPSDANHGIVTILGFVPLASIASAAHFVVPLSLGISVAALAVGYALLVAYRVRLRETLSFQCVGAAVPVLLVVSLFASRPLRHFDTGLYHVQSVKWCTTYPLVRGLANLHERLAFNSLWTPLSAVVDFPAFAGLACFPITCLLLFAFGWAASIAIWRMKDSCPKDEDVFLAACGCFWMWLVVSDSTLVVLPSLSSDVPVYFTTLVCAYLLLRFGSQRDYLDLFQALAVGALALTFKVSAAPLFLFLLVFFAFTWLRDGKKPAAARSSWVPTGIVVAALLALWVARSVYLSGYLVFPISATALTFLPWHLPIPMAQQLVETLQTWARAPGIAPELVLASSGWVGGWIERLAEEEIFYTSVAYAIFGGAMIVASRAASRREAVTKYWPVAVMLAAGVVYWMLTAPDTRYGFAYLFAGGCLLFARGLALFLRGRARLAAVVLCSTAVIPLLTVSDVSHFLFYGLPRLGAGRHSVQTTTQGTTLYVAQGNQMILDGPLPSTPYFRPTLLTRTDRHGRIVEFLLPQAVHTPYYGIPQANSGGGGASDGAGR